MALRQGKKINMAVAGFDASCLTTTVRKDLLSLASQLLRNAVSHGIESIAKRQAAGKAAEGKVNLSLSRQTDGISILTCEDDGYGVDFDALTRKALEQGLIDAHLSNSITHQQLLNLMLQQRLSSTHVVDIDSGRGVGLNVVGSIARRLGAKVSLQTLSGSGTKFIIRIPATAIKRVSHD